MNHLDNKVAVITGGIRGIGFGICEVFGSAGCQLIIADISEQNVRAAGQGLRHAG